MHIKNNGFNLQNLILNKLIHEEYDADVAIELDYIHYSYGQYEKNRLAIIRYTSLSQVDIIRNDFKHLYTAEQCKSFDRYILSSNKHAHIVYHQYKTFLYRLPWFKQYLKLSIARNNNLNYEEYFANFFDQPTVKKLLSVI